MHDAFAFVSQLLRELSEQLRGNVLGLVELAAVVTGTLIADQLATQAEQVRLVLVFALGEFAAHQAIVIVGVVPAAFQEVGVRRGHDGIIRAGTDRVVHPNPLVNLQGMPARIEARQRAVRQVRNQDEFRVGPVLGFPVAADRESPLGDL